MGRARTSTAALTIALTMRVGWGSLRAMKTCWIVVVAVAAMGCTAARSKGGGSKEAGDSCTAAQAESDETVCTSSKQETLECKENDGKFTWKIDKDCAALGQTCSSGECVEKSATPDVTSGGDSGSSTACPDFSGSWAFDKHCEVQYVGSTVNVSQSGCNFSFSGGGLTSASGTIVASAATITVTGTSSNGPISCVGTYEEKEDGVTGITIDCPSCDIEVKRP
jgi:hypothetical protein